jgi:response regulator RpfG family c-di-GMP phosphodiesterase
MRRLRARSRLTPRSAERQVRDALLQTLAECRTVSSAVDVPQVAAATVATGRSVGMDLGQLDVLVRAAELQDIGKLAIPDEILGKRGELSPGEWDVVRQHPVVAERILSAASALAPVARIVRSCAERYDGTGYPDGLSGDAIPHGARIIAVCVAFDAMTSLRPYRPALAPAAALVELIRCAGAQFDPTVVASFAATLDL